MATKIFLQDNFNGGVAEGSKIGYTNSFQDGIGADFRTDPDRLSALPSLAKDSGSTIVDLIKVAKEYKGKKFFYGDVGNLYQKDVSNAYSLLKTVSTSTGQGFDIFSDSLWYANNITIGKATGLTGTPVFTDNYIATEQQEAIAITRYLGVSNHYAVPTLISEASTNKYSFTATLVSIRGIFVSVGAKGTGDWTITVHDASNNVIGTDTITNANISGNVNMRWIFASPIPVVVGTTYHFHITSTVNDANIICNTTNNLTTAVISVFNTISDKDIDQFSKGSIDSSGMHDVSNTYIPITTISEIATAKLTFVPVVPVLSGISLLMIANSAVTITLTLHDAQNQVIGTATLVQATSGNYSWSQFTFATPLTLVIGATYHIHITYATNAPSILTSTNVDLSTAYFKTHYGALLTDSNFHNAKVFGNKICFGNTRYLATIDDSEVYNPAAVAVPSDESIRCLEAIGDYLAVSTWKGNDITKYGASRIYFWDGISPFFNVFIDIDGQVNAIKNDGNNNLYVLHGTQGNISVYTGAITKLRRIKSMKIGDSTQFLPNAIDNLEGILYFGNGTSNTSNFDTMVYSYGRKDKDYTRTLNKDFIISTGNHNSNVTIGAILGISPSEFYVSWKDTSSGTVYGIDNLNNSNPYSGAFVRILRFDAGNPHLEKVVNTVSIRYDKIIANQKIEIFYQINNSGGFTSLGTIDPSTDTGKPLADLNSTLKTFSMPSSMMKFFEIEFKIVITLLAGGVASPTILSFAMEYIYPDSQEFQYGTKQVSPTT